MPQGQKRLSYFWGSSSSKREHTSEDLNGTSPRTEENASPTQIRTAHAFKKTKGLLKQLRSTFGNNDRHDSAQQLMESRIQKPNESVAMFAEDMTRLFQRADPELPEAKKLRHLMRGVKEQLFAGHLRNPPTTVAEFVQEATTIERALQQRCRYYDRPNNASNSVSALTAGCEGALRELIREVVREGIRNLLVTPQEPAMASVAEVVRHEVRQEFSLPESLPDQRSVNYASAVRRPTPVSHNSSPLAHTCNQPVIPSYIPPPPEPVIPAYIAPPPPPTPQLNAHTETSSFYAPPTSAAWSQRMATSRPFVQISDFCADLSICSF
ncbi:arp2/3 complex-activating protein rickA-like [Rhipicephalus sanguineus]|uniref:arp2/3 complex-activating protein rickA-like n=1 Tax=Rhipicephalus sanguineus TaxID=34632 RepID=UPI001895C5F7|nr:arp2/3 complex-activating protein rickA-like [Rhipicephalus sanguineus]